MKWISYILFIAILAGLVSCRGDISGCTDPKAKNYERRATCNDGSCTYNSTSISPILTSILNDKLSETSGLLFWDGLLWTHNDNRDIVLYGLDPKTGKINTEIPLPGVKNIDWEDISQDEQFIYLGDIGNNTKGKREDLKILRIDKQSIQTGTPKIDSIGFSFSDQCLGEEMPQNSSDFDCEAFCVLGDSIYLFTKQWTSGQTTLFSLPNMPGNYQATKKSSYNVQGLITGATQIESRGLVVLSGYTTLLNPFLYLLYDYNGQDFFSGNKRRLDITLPFHQVEGICFQNGYTCFLTNEYFKYKSILNTQQKLHYFNLEPYLKQ